MQSDKSNPKIARVGEAYLFQSDIDELTFELSPEDSAEVANTYIDTWVKEQLLLQKAMQNLSENQIDFEQQLEDYRNSLVIYAYENELIKQKLDTNVTMSQVERYFKDNISNFELRQDIVLFRLIKVLNSAPKQDTLIEWMPRSDREANDKLVEYCAQFANRCDLDTNNWLPYSSLVKLIPSQSNEDEIDLQKRDLQIISDTLETAYLHVIATRNKGEIAPVEYVKDQIVEIVKNKRRLALLSGVREEIFEEATLNRKYELYTKN